MNWKERRLVCAALGLTCLLLVVRAGVSADNAGPWVAFNDHTAGTGTAINVSPYSLRLHGSGGPLTNQATGARLPAGLAVTTSGSLVANASGAMPNAGTPAYNLFNGYVDFYKSGSSDNGLLIYASTNQFVTLTFTNLAPDKRYSFRGTSNRNGTDDGSANSNFHLRWTLCSLAGAVSFADAHSTGCVTAASLPASGLAAGQAAYNSGMNTASGDVVGWDDIMPGANGSFSIIQTQYLGLIWSGEMANPPNNMPGYGINGFRLAMQPSPAIQILSEPPEDVDVAQFGTTNWTVVVDGAAARFQWFHDAALIPWGTNATLTVANAQPSDSGTYYCVITNAISGTNSSPVALIVHRASTPPTLLRSVRSHDLTNLFVTFSTDMSTNVTAAHGNALAPTNFTVFQTMNPTGTLSVQGFPAASGPGAFSTNGQATVRFTLESPLDRGYDAQASYTLMAGNVADLADVKIADRSAVVITPEEAGFDSLLELVAGPPSNHLYVPYGKPFHIAFDFGRGLAQFQWYKNGRAISGANSSALGFPAATAEDAGTYDLRAWNSSRSTNSPSSVVTVRPDFSGQGRVYFVIGSDTAIWNTNTTVDVYTRYPHYKQDSFANPGMPSFLVMDPALRNRYVDSYGQTLRFTWWMMGGNIYRDADNINVPLANTMTLYLMKKYHGDAIRQFGDELSLHYHTFLWSDYNGDGTYHWNQSRTFNECRADFDVTLAQYLLEEEVFPVSFRSGWHFMDNDWQNCLNELLPYCLHDDSGVNVAWALPEPVDGAENWSRAPSVFVPFHPATNDYQVPGNGKGWNTRSIKMQNLSQTTMNQVFAQAAAGTDQVMCIWNHLPESFLSYLATTLSYIQTAGSNNPSVPFAYCTALEGMQRWLGTSDHTPPSLSVSESLQGDTLTLTLQTDEPIFQTQPFVAVKDTLAQYAVLPCSPAGTNAWTVTVPVPRRHIAKIGIALTDEVGNQTTRILRYLPDERYLDNLDPQYAEVTGNWVRTTNAAWGTDARVALLASNQTARVQWSLPISTSGYYNLAAQVPTVSNPAGALAYSVFAGKSNVYSAALSNPLPGHQWVSLGTLFLDQTMTNSLVLTVSGMNQPGTYAVADVIRLSPVVPDLPNLADARFAGSTFSLTFPSQAGLSYVLESKVSLADTGWTLVRRINGDGNRLSLADPSAAAPNRFYRIRIE
jgi:hypothetical protein